MVLKDSTRNINRDPVPGTRMPPCGSFRGLVNKETGELITPPIWDLMTTMYPEESDHRGTFIVWDERGIVSGIHLDLSGLAIEDPELVPCPGKEDL